jgi:hypothetical protein
MVALTEVEVRRRWWLQSQRRRRPTSDKKSSGVRSCSRTRKGRRGGGENEWAATTLDAFKAVRRGSKGGGCWSGAEPHDKEVGKGPARPAGGQQRPDCGACVGSTRTGEDGALTHGPGHRVGF